MDDLPVDDRRWFVEQQDDGDGFLVRRYHRDNASATASSKEGAIDRAFELAENHSTKNKRSQVKIRDGGSFSEVVDFVDGREV